MKLAHHQAGMKSNKGVDANYNLRAHISHIFNKITKSNTFAASSSCSCYISSSLRNVIIPLRLFINCTSMYASHIHYTDFLLFHSLIYAHTTVSHGWKNCILNLWCDFPWGHMRFLTYPLTSMTKSRKCASIFYYYIFTKSSLLYPHDAIILNVSLYHFMHLFLKT